ncbi:MAG: complex I NDUFA9 subunit family protein [Halobacteriaceae archaeon]
MKVLVVGGTGFLGTALVRELDDRGHDVTALSRDPSGTDLPASVERVQEDIRDRDRLTEVATDHEAIVNLVALSPLRVPSGGETMHDEIHRQGTEHVVAAAEAADATHLVQLSALGADPNGPTHYLRAKGRAEAAVRESTVPWTIFRPSVVFGDGGEFVSFTRTLTPPVLAPLPGGGRTKFQPIWRGDIVPMIADATVEGGHDGETYEIGGPEVLRLAQVAKLSREALGQKTRILPVPMALAGLGLTVMGAIPGAPFGRDQYRSLQMDNVTTENDVSAFGVAESDLRTLRDYLGLSEAIGEQSVAGPA